MSKSNQSEISTKTLAICALGAATIALALLNQRALAGAALIALAVAVLIPKDCSKRVLRAVVAFREEGDVEANDGGYVVQERAPVVHTSVDTSVDASGTSVTAASSFVNQRLNRPDNLHTVDPHARESHMNYRTQSTLRYGGHM